MIFANPWHFYLYPLKIFTDYCNFFSNQLHFTDTANEISVSVTEKYKENATFCACIGEQIWHI